MSIWKAANPVSLPCPEFAGETACEVAVIGAGITGALISHILSRAGVDVVVLDREEVGGGSTAASTGLLQYEVDTPLVDLISEMGESRAAHVYRRSLSAISELESLVDDLPGNCGFARRSTLYLASRPDDVPHLRREHACRRDFGFEVEFLDRSRLAAFSGINAPAALYSHGDGEVNPYLLTRSVLESGLTNGIRAFRDSEVMEVREHSRGVTVVLRGGRIEAEAAVVATGYAARPFLPSYAAELQTTYAVASAPLDETTFWPGRFLIWETARPYFYARLTPDDRALIGGEDTPGATDHRNPALITEKAARLIRRFNTLFPLIDFRPAASWAGTFAVTRDSLPHIGRPAGHDRVFFALGYGGNGITFAMIAAQLITDLYLRRPNQDAGLFRFDR